MKRALRCLPDAEVVVQSDEFSHSHIRTTVVVALTSNLRLAAAPGNVLCRSRQTGLPRDSVINVSQILTLDKGFLTDRIRMLSPELFRKVEEGLRLVAALPTQLV